ncbi:Sas10/Utp3/C1D family protein [Thelonectria olida]|uniref:Exosome complex protein n=1 Tax=Thelonectria olida TaxID=1576542 RepID=A0A9P9AJP7_9HYPO|nr:Sas10/Utp3/C1D family protein [Thelonectria olida]
MADVKDIEPDLLRLDDQLEALEEALQPMLGDLEGLSSQLPLLDKAKFFSLSAYAIDSLLFSALKLQGTDAANHAVFDELKRVQQYFAKIKAAETPTPAPAEETRTLTVNQEATARILKADLGDNKIISSKLAEKIAEERAKALLKSVENRKRPAESPVPPPASASDAPAGKSKKKQKKNRQRK